MPSHHTHVNGTGLILIPDNHKITLCNDPTVHMVPLPSAEPSEVNAVKTTARLTLSQTHKTTLSIPAHSLSTVTQL